MADWSKDCIPSGHQSLFWPGIFHRITQAIRHMLIRRGLTATVVYLDDFFYQSGYFSRLFGSNEFAYFIA